MFSRIIQQASLLVGAALVSISLGACRSKSESPVQDKEAASESRVEKPTVAPVSVKQAPQAEDFLDQPWAGLRVHERGTPLAQANRVVVLFHGYGAPGDDLVSLASVWEVEGTAFLFPEAPVALPQGGRAWFSRDRSDFETGYQRALGFLLALQKRAPELPLVVGGFSQGAMLTINLLAAAPGNLQAGLIFSPAPLLPHEPSQSSPRVPLLITHGSRDQVLPFSGGEEVRDRFLAWGYPVTWVPFVGPHTIAREAVAETRSLLESLVPPSLQGQ